VSASARPIAYSTDIVLLTPRAGKLAVLVRQAAGARGRGVVLPWAVPRGADTLVASARGAARIAAGVEPNWLEQLAAFGDGLRHPSGSAVSIAFVGVLPGGAAESAAARASGDGTWVAVADAPSLPPRQAAMLDAAVSAIRARLDHSPIAFKLLPIAFTLSDLQGMYELILGRRLHKASFRRSLQAAFLVEPTDEWRSEGRGRPAQLYRYAPRKRRSSRRGVRFELLGS
jgi:8-oxo-dGTP diphosphatase